MQLPVSALPQVDYPTIQVVTFYPGASPEVMSSSVTAPLERQFGQVPGLSQMTSTSSFGSSVITLQFGLDENIDVAEQEVQAAINCRADVSAARSAESADLQQGESGGCADPDAGADVGNAAAVEGGGPCGHAAGAEDFAVAGRGAGEHQRRAEAGRAHSGESDGAGLVRLEPGRSADGARRRRTSIRRKGCFDGPRQSYTIGANDQLLSSEQYKPMVIAYRNGAPVRLSDVANVIDGVGERAAGGVDESDAGGDHEHPAAAGRQHHREWWTASRSCCRNCRRRCRRR